MNRVFQVLNPLLDTVTVDTGYTSPLPGYCAPDHNDSRYTFFVACTSINDGPVGEHGPAIMGHIENILMTAQANIVRHTLIHAFPCFITVIRFGTPQKVKS